MHHRILISPSFVEGFYKEKIKFLLRSSSRPETGLEFTRQHCAGNVAVATSATAEKLQHLTSSSTHSMFHKLPP